jgi:hypothetical protein
MNISERYPTLWASRADIAFFAASLLLSLGALYFGAHVTQQDFPFGVHAGGFGMNAIYVFSVGALLRPYDLRWCLWLSAPIAAAVTHFEIMAHLSIFLNTLIDNEPKPAVDLYRTQRLGIGLGVAAALFFLLATARRSFARVLAVTMLFASGCVLVGYHTTTVMVAYQPHKDAKADMLTEIGMLVVETNPARGEVCPDDPIESLMCIEVGFGEPLPDLGRFILSTTVYDFIEQWDRDPFPREVVALKHSAFDATHAHVVSIAGGWVPTQWGGAFVLTDRPAKIDIVFSEPISAVLLMTFAVWGFAGACLARLHPGAKLPKRTSA